jgi:outer membrane protein TolC
VSAAVAAEARASVAVSAAVRARDASGAELAGVLGWDPARALASAGALPGDDDVSLATLRAHLAGHPEHVASAARVDAADATATRVRKQRIPSLALDLEAAFDDPTTPGTDLVGGITVELPIFAHVGAQLRAARATRTAEQARLSATDAQLAGALEAAYDRWQAARASATSLARDVLPAQERATALAEQAYREGSRDLGTALQAERDLASVRAQLANAVADLATAWLALHLAAGDDAR